MQGVPPQPPGRYGTGSASGRLHGSVSRDRVLTRRRKWQRVCSADSREPRSSKARFWMHAGKVKTVNGRVDCRGDAPNADPRVAMGQHRSERQRHTLAPSQHALRCRQATKFCSGVVDVRERVPGALGVASVDQDPHRARGDVKAPRESPEPDQVL